MKRDNLAILILITGIAAFLRFYDYLHVPFTADEFSALFRTRFAGFTELISGGVIVDGHPAGIQVFLYYWTKAFGYDEWVVKLPFVVMGILSVWLVFLIGNKWFNVTVGMISASFIATIQYTVMYSLIARPYISGLFFSLLTVWCWSKVMLEPEKRFHRNLFCFIIAAALCAYNHHFSLLFAGIVGISGLFLVKRRYLLRYILSGVIIFMLYLPHLNIFLSQLKLGGVGAWLGKPGVDFIFGYFGYIFHYSFVVLVVITGLILFGVFRSNKTEAGKYLLFASWFILPLVIGFLYSHLFSPVLQFSVLIVSVPYLFFVLFGHLGEQKSLVNFILVGVIMSANIYSLVFERQFYTLFHLSPYKQVLIDDQEARSEHDKVLCVIDANREKVEHYAQKLNIATEFKWYGDFAMEKDLVSYLKSHYDRYDFLYFGSFSGSDPVIIPIIREFFPTLEWQQNYAGGTTFLFSKTPGAESINRIALDFENAEPEGWLMTGNEIITDSVFCGGHHACLIGSDCEWSPALSVPLKRIAENRYGFIDISVSVLLNGPGDDILLVASLQKEDKTLYWNAKPFSRYLSNDSAKNEWTRIHLSLKLIDIIKSVKDQQLKVYIWNKGQKDFFIDDFKVRFRKGNPLLYGLYEPF